MSDPRYPIGKFSPPAAYGPEQRARFIAEINEAPRRLRAAVEGLTREQLETPYREGGWTAAQVVHHVPDSHLNSYTRFKLAVTEDAPEIKAYDEAAWARLPDASDSGSIEVSLALLDTLHARWVRFLRALEPEQLSRTFRHSELGPVTLDRTLALYAWHGCHHTAHITTLRERMGW